VSVRSVVARVKVFAIIKLCNAIASTMFVAINNSCIDKYLIFSLRAILFWLLNFEIYILKQVN